MMQMEQLKTLWEEFRNIPVFFDNQDYEDFTIELPFLHFSVGTDIVEIWKWFESQNEGFSVTDIIEGR